MSIIKNFLLPYISLIGFLSLWTIYKLSLPKIFNSYSQYSADSYTSTIFIIFSNFDNFILSLKLFITEIYYLIGSVIILPIAGLIILMLLIFTTQYETVSMGEKKSLLNKENRDIRSLSYVLPFYLLCSLGMIFITVLHMYGPVSNGDNAYLIFGRYIDPIIPPILTFGVLGIYFISTNQEKIIKITRDFVFFVLGLTIISLIFLPPKWGWVYNSLSSWHISILQSAYSPTIAQLFLIITTWIAVAIFLYLLLKRKNIFSLIFYFGIIFLIAIGLTFPQMMVGGQQLDKVSEYFQNQSIKNIKIGADKNEINNRFLIISFWSSNEIINDVFSSEQIRNNQTFYSSKYDYIISHKQLPLTPIVIDDTYLVTLYSTSSNTSHPYILTPILFKSGFSGPEFWSSSVDPTRWMTADANLEVYSHENMNATLTFNAVSFNDARNLDIYLEEKLVSQLNIPSSKFITVSVPLAFKNGANNIELHPDSCEKPSSIPKMNNSDPRCLSIAVQNISVN